MSRRLATATLASAVALLGGTMSCAQSGAPVEQGAPNVPDFSPAFPEQTRAPAADSGVTLEVESVAEGLENPWGIAVTPDGAILVTEKPGRLRVVQDGELLPNPVAGVPEVLAEDHGGLLDVALGPDFATDRMVYWTYSKPMGNGTSATAAARGRLSEDFTELTGVEDIFVQDPPSPTPMHFGSRLAFDDEGHVFITTGEHYTEEERVLAQDLGAAYGKVIRVALDGSIPADNPFVDEGGVAASVWSYGHRNIQSAAVHPETGALWIVEHGPQGGDEINLIEPGANYGWPIVSYGENYEGTPVGGGESRAEGLVEPRYYWDPVIAPGGMVFYEGAAFPEWEGDLLVSGLVAQSVVRIELDGDTVIGEERLLTDQGRVRDLAIDADGAVLAAIDAPDGALLRLTPEGESLTD
ncbi:MAG: PQQ-dependent sugar dehydrogenase [Rhodobacteraceae bacterium]|nr:PQQ-dependent sugar dehydrogenase [Paracoccaceae bacterium]